MAQDRDISVHLFSDLIFIGDYCKRGSGTQTNHGNYALETIRALTISWTAVLTNEV